MKYESPMVQCFSKKNLVHMISGGARCPNAFCDMGTVFSCGASTAFRAHW